MNNVIRVNIAEAPNSVDYNEKADTGMKVRSRRYGRGPQIVTIITEPCRMSFWIGREKTVATPRISAKLWGMPSGKVAQRGRVLNGYRL